MVFFFLNLIEFLFFGFIVFGFVGLEVLVFMGGMFLLDDIVMVLLNRKLRWFFGYFGL